MGDQTSSWPSSFVNASSMAWRGEDPPSLERPDPTHLVLCVLTLLPCSLVSERSLRETQGQMPGAGLCSPQPGNDPADAVCPDSGEVIGDDV